jgi:uncharacterized protein (TIGR02596 family)
MKRFPLRLHPQARGFTLIEILVVLTVLAVLITAATPAVTGMMKSSRLTTAGDLVLNHLVEAQLTAITESTDVEVRLYEIPDIGSADQTPLMRGLQLYALRPDPADANDSTFQAATPLLRLEHGLVISMDRRLSSVLGLKLKEDASPGILHGRQYVAFRFHSDGSTDLVPSEPWFLTLLDQDSANGKKQPPANYFTIQIDPINGKLRTFRP